MNKLQALSLYGNIEVGFDNITQIPEMALCYFIDCTWIKATPHKYQNPHYAIGAK